MRDIPAQRHWHLEGLRGLACLAVVLLHGFGAFFPVLVEKQGMESALDWVRDSPLRLLYDGDAAVFLFFSLSGFVLTAPFLRDAGRPGALIAARIARFLPAVLFGCLAGWLLSLASGSLHLQAAEVIGGGWLAGGWETPATFAALLQDSLGNALLLGYRDLSLLDPVMHDSLWPNGAAFDAPLWTLSVELQGSLVVLALAMARRRARLLWAGAVLLCAVFFLRSPFLCFLVGHLAAVHQARGEGRGLGRLGACLAGLLGLALCLDAASGPAQAITLLAGAHLPLLPALAPDLVQRGFGAMLVFLALHRAGGGWLESPAALWLGRMSFPIYLIHWPMLLAPGAAVTCALAGLLPAPLAAAAGMAAAFALTLLAATPLARLDRAAMGLARRLRDYRQGSTSTLACNSGLARSAKA